MIILGIETSCDETSASIVQRRYGKIKILSNIIFSQINIHKKYGGVVPEIAGREHVLNILPVIDQALIKAKIKLKQIDAIAVTNKPGLITSLIVGVETAKVLSYGLSIPLIKINHIEGHIYANWLSPISKISNFQFPISKKKSNIFPALILTVSGGHTMLILMKDHGKYQIIGNTVDDATGEAFDKAAKMMGLSYPGGPAVAAEAAKFDQKEKRYALCVPCYASLPRPMINSQNYNFSFSGLKTALLYALKKDKNYKKKIPEYCYEFQQAIIDVLISKTIKAALEFKVNAIMLTGGVSANKALREQIKKAVASKAPDLKLKITNLSYCGDNAAMIAMAGYYHALKKDFIKWDKIRADCSVNI
ncbi:tRNA (adenosine(37)-N6)-threonylcarbamoyltransferase complex transferase subunit TsaD [Patescibacteria group bacterium]|nr:tRNA (adenosine(37)-N6)-threonylcarbamoyltransferase complex transferase subunit TsaD [Patescibacteria group bacterium]MBU1160358.1 tRNA (adenosine(37)-N6)-threonylcarbamoyltransferase complex transferase subunit TsaD [Patescibacteria group bacterium]MBU1350070.1 tRNA (adenosine(37)-N6)-threonylcarbamoyltransferase complex transferase subunit TsaD [Patescibacteria group bacterium]MBU1421396.1 tRNA (adenosine(37)-N6)-threonylcarbamoyltransferase complex transferase subunit TsaD [Patescibacteri